MRRTYADARSLSCRHMTCMQRVATAGATLFPLFRPYPSQDRNFLRTCNVYCEPTTPACRIESVPHIKECTVMRKLVVGAAVALLLASSVAQAQTTLRIGLAEDPDVLDPTLARTYVGRIVFAALCDKLFDIDDKLNIVPQLALSHEAAGDGKTVTLKLRPGVVFHDGEAMDAEAVKASLERHMTMQGSFRKPELASVDKVEVVAAATVRLQ